MSSAQAHQCSQRRPQEWPRAAVPPGALSSIVRELRPSASRRLRQEPRAKCAPESYGTDDDHAKSSPDSKSSEKISQMLKALS